MVLIVCSLKHSHSNHDTTKSISLCLKTEGPFGTKKYERQLELFIGQKRVTESDCLLRYNNETDDMVLLFTLQTFRASVRYNFPAFSLTCYYQGAASLYRDELQCP